MPQDSPPINQQEDVSQITFIEDYYIVKPAAQTNEGLAKSPTKVKNYLPHRGMEKKSAKQQGGIRQNRRSENTKFLLSLGEGDEVGSELTESFVEIRDPYTTPFDELFLEQEKMKAWNNFMESPEEEQELLLAGEWLPVSHSSCQDKADAEAMEKDFDIIDKREVHPAFSAEECFKQVDGGFKAFLKKKHVPWGSLQHLETQIIPFFEDWPGSVFVSQLPGPVDRLLLHALCQYLNLCSFSFNGDDGTRHTQVENRNSDFFTAPPITLSQYLTGKH